MRALPVALTLMDQACAGKHDTDLGNRLTDQASGRDHEYVCEDRGARRVREDPVGPVNLSGEMRTAGLMEPEGGSAGIVQASGVPGAG